jgi:hypothetical protein
MRPSDWIVLSALMVNGCEATEETAAGPVPRVEADATVKDLGSPSTGGGGSPSAGGAGSPSAGGAGSPSAGGGGSTFGAGGESISLGAGCPGPDPCSGVECEAGFECDRRTGQCRDSDLCDDVDCGSEAMCDPNSGACVTNLFEMLILCEYFNTVCGSGSPESVRNCLLGTSSNVVDLDCFLAARCDANVEANCGRATVIDDVCPQVTCDPGSACRPGPRGECIALPDCDAACDSLVACGPRYGTLDECLVTCHGFWGARDRICLLAAECSAEIQDFCWTP